MTFFKKLIKKIFPDEYILEILQDRIPDGAFLINSKGIYYFSNPAKISLILNTVYDENPFHSNIRVMYYADIVIVDGEIKKNRYSDSIGDRLELELK